MSLEMEEAIRALGKSSLKDLSSEDLVALDTVTAELTGVKLVSKAQPDVPESFSAHEINNTLQTNCQKELNELYASLRHASYVVQILEIMIIKLRAGKNVVRNH
jgi:hypothetical protein